MAYRDLKEWNWSTFVNKVLRDKAFYFAKDSKCDGYQRGLASMVYRFFDKKTFGSGIKKKNTSNEELVEELHKPIIRNFNQRK